ncbi:MAG: serine/threonine-protein kinase [Polyangiaceae bacterium]
MWGSEADQLAPVKAGDILADKYEVEKVLGVGGMGVVVAARHIHLGGRVALKFLRPAAADSPETVARFTREAQAATRIKSEHVAKVTDVGKLDTGSPYMVMEFLEGQDLGQMLMERGRLHVSEAVDYVMQAMEAIAEAHQLGIVHRDLKPSNLFVTRRADDSPLVKVLDFGIAKANEGGQSQQLTQTAGVMGSPLYMAPEQIRSSKHVDPRADIWSLAIILYELLAGRSPFDGESAGAVFAAIVADPPPPLRVARPDVPPELEAIINRCLAKSPDQRFTTVADLASALAPFGGRDTQVSVGRITGVFTKGSAVGAVTNPVLVGGTLVDSSAAHAHPAPLAGSQPQIPPTANTRGAWGSNTGQPSATYTGTKKSSARLFIGLAGGALVLIVVAVVGGVALTHKSAAATPPPQGEPVATPPTPSASPTVAPTAATTAAAPDPAPSATPPETKPESTATSPTRPSGKGTTSTKNDPKTPSTKPTATGDDALGHR